MVTMTNTTENTSAGELMSTIATVRELLMKDFNSTSQDVVEDALNATKQSRYEERVEFNSTVQEQKDVIKDLQGQIERAKEEARLEKSIRLTLEQTNEGLEEHKKALSEQLDAVSKSRGSLEGTIRGARSSMEKEKVSHGTEKEELRTSLEEALLKMNTAFKQSGEWEARHLASQREMAELQKELELCKSNLEETRTKYEAMIQDNSATVESFRRSLQESAEARKKAEESLNALTSQGQKNSQETFDSTFKETQEEPTPQGELPETRALEGRIRMLEDENSKLQEELSKSTMDREERSSATGSLAGAKEGHNGSDEAGTQKKSEEKEANLERQLLGLTEEEMQEEQENLDKIMAKIASLKSTFEKMTTQSTGMQKAVEALGSPVSRLGLQKLAKKSAVLEMGRTKVGAVLETLEGKLKERLAITDGRAQVLSTKLSAVRAKWQVAKEEQTNAQSELDMCRSRMELLAKEIEPSVELPQLDSTAKSAASKTPKARSTKRALSEGDDQRNRKQRQKK